MEEAEVIDIDDLLGSSTPVGQQDAEEYDFENFSNEGEQVVELESDTVAPGTPASSRVSTQGGRKERNTALGNHQPHQAPRKSSLEDNFKGLFLSSKSSKRKFQDQELSLIGNNNVTWEKDSHSVEGNENSGSFSDAKVAQNEALVDAFIQGEASDVVLSEEELCIDVNSEELRQFILEFEANKESTNNPQNVSGCGEGIPKQGIAVVNHRRTQSDDQDSLNSSISTTESHNGSLTSSLASSDLSPVRTKPKTPRGKSVRFLMSNLLRNNKAHHHLPGRTSGSDEDAKDAKRGPAKPKDRSKKKDKEEREDRTPKQHSRLARTQQANPALPSSKILTHPTAQTQQGRSGDKVSDSHAQPRNQLSTAAVATLLTPGGRDYTLHKQLIQGAARGDLQVLEFLLAANEGLSEVRDNRGNSLLHAVARRGHVNCLAWLAAGPCAELLSVENDDCFTAAALAVKHGQLECVKCLAEHPEVQLELQAQDNRWSLLHFAARFGQEPCLRWLLEHMQTLDIPLDQTDHSNNSPTHLAAKYGHLQCLQTLVEFNSDVTLLNKKRQTPCTLAMRYHHDTCAQFLVVVETCIKLSSELTLTQRKLRESQQEKEALAKKLREAMSCTDALVHMQKTDLSQRIEQIRGEYVDLTNLLVRQLDQMHRHQTQTGGDTAPTISREDVLVAEQKAEQLDQACSELLDQSQREDISGSQLQEIERRLSRLQPLPTSPIWPLPPAEHSTDLALDSMRARLGEVTHQISTLHHPSPSLASDNLDTLSLSSSYASSLSSSSSSLQTGMVQSSPRHSVKKHKVSWNGEHSQRVESGNEKTEETRTDQQQNPNGTCGKLESGVGKGTESDPCDLSRDTQGQRSNLPQTRKCETEEHLGMQYLRKEGAGQTQDVFRNSNPSQAKANVLHVQATIEHWEPFFHSDSSLDSRSPVSKTHKETLEPSEDLSGNLPPSYEESCARHSRNPLKVKSLLSVEDTAKRKTQPTSRKPDEKQSLPDQTDPKLPQMSTFYPTGEEQEIPERCSLSSFDKLPRNVESYQVSVKHHVLPLKHCQQTVPDFMRKVQPTNEFGEPESGKVVVKISNGEEMVLPPPQTMDGQERSSHQRVNSNSSISSTSSDLPWSESDPDESPHLNRPSHRGGILSKKSTNGGKKSQEKHITFALDDTDAKSNTGGKPNPSKRRDLSPIYEAPDLVKSTNDDSKSQDKNLSKTNKDATLQVVDTEKASSLGQDSRSSVGRRNFRLFSYSSDEGDHDGQEGNKMQRTSPGHDHENLKYPDGLTDVVSLEFEGVQDENDVNGCSQEDLQEKLWYESSSDEDDQNDNCHLQIPASGGFERHICYL